VQGGNAHGPLTSAGFGQKYLNKIIRLARIDAIHPDLARQLLYLPQCNTNAGSLA